MSKSQEPGEGLSAWLSLLQAHSVLTDVLERELEQRAGLDLGFFEVLFHLTSAPEGRMSMQELAQTILLSKSGVTRLVDRMEKAGLVERAACPSDRRVTWAVVTEKGRGSLDEALPVHLGGLQSHFLGHLNAADLRSLRAILTKLLRAHGRDDPVCTETAFADPQLKG
jgi:DNA-binding MarR family transcriptional regulator